LEEENTKTELDQTGQNLNKQLKLLGDLETLAKEENDIIERRKQQPYKITIGNMPENERYNKLKTESKHLQNIIKMICYRAETAFANMLAIDYKKKTNEIRALVKSIIFTKADLMPNYKSNTLTITLYALATKRDNNAIENICQLLNDTETIYSGSNLKLVYKTATI
jgi:hypothetical protein